MPSLLQLTEQQRRAQDQLRRALQARVKDTYARMVDPANPRATARPWLAAVAPAVFAYRSRSEALARASYTQSRRAGAPGAPAAPFVRAVTIPRKAVETSLYVTGIIGLTQRLDKGLSQIEALDRASKAAAGAAVRHALDGGRSYSQNAVNADRVALGWYRVTKAGCCSFCAVLASRGAVYKGDSFDQSDPRFIGGGEEKVHDHCVCTLGAIYSRDQETPELSRSFTTLWEQTSKGFSGNDALNSFRRAYEKLYPSAAG